MIKRRTQHHFTLSALFTLLTVVIPISALAIRSGTPVMPSESLYQSAVIILRSNPKSVCSGFVLSAHFVLTAAHCISKDPDNPLAMKDTDKLAIFPGNILNEKIDRSRIRIITGADTIVHPEYSGLLHDGKLKGNFNDIALIHIKNGLPSDLIPAQIQWNISNLYKGKKAYVAGFGQTESDKDSQIMMLRILEVGVVDPFVKELEQTIMQPIYSLSGIVKGDSGGPAFLMDGNTPTVFGVASFGNLSTLSKGSTLFAYEPLSKHWIWIQKVAQELGLAGEIR